MAGMLRRAIPRVLTGALLIPSLLVLVLPALVSADETQYADSQLEDWLIEQIASTQIEVTAPPSVALDAAGRRMVVEDCVLEVRGITIGLSYLRLTATGTDAGVSVVGELDVLGKHPRFWCDAEFEFLETEDRLRVSSVSNVRIGDCEPDLSQDDLDAVAGCFNCLLDASELSIVAPGGDLLTIDVVDDAGTPKLQTTWSGGDTAYLDAGEIEDALGDMAETLASKANDYLAAASPDWSVDVVAEDDLLKVTTRFSLCGKDFTLQLQFAFDGLGFTFSDSSLAVGSETVTFSGAGGLSSTAYVPHVTMTDFTPGNEHPYLRDCVVDVEDALLDALNDMFGTFIEDIGLTLDVRTITSVSLDGSNLVVEGACLVEGDANLDGATNIVDAMFIAQYTVGMREFDSEQMVAADTTDDGKVNIVDAMHVAQYTVDPHGNANILFKPVWECDCDEGVTVDPLSL
jgi:hypothetical protein